MLSALLIGISYHDGSWLPETKLAITIVSLPTFYEYYVDHKEVSMAFYQSSNGSIQMTLEITKDNYQVSLVADGTLNGSGLSHLSKTPASGSTPDIGHTSLFYTSRDGFLQERRAISAPDDPARLSWEQGKLGTSNLFKPSPNDTTLATGYSTCTSAQGSVWLFYRPERNASVVQELHWDGGTDSWSNGPSFPGFKPGTALVTFDVLASTIFNGPISSKLAKPPTVRFLYGLGDDGKLQEWYCFDCCTSTGKWLKSVPHMSDPFVNR